MAVMQRLRCSADCGASEFDAMVSRRKVGRPPCQREKLFIVDKTPGKDGFPSSREVKAVCKRCRAALEVVMMGAAIGGRARRAIEVEEIHGFCPGSIAGHVGGGALFKNDVTGEVFEGRIIGMRRNAVTGEEVAAIAVRDGDDQAFFASHGCGKSTDPESVN